MRRASSRAATVPPAAPRPDAWREVGVDADGAVWCRRGCSWTSAQPRRPGPAISSRPLSSTRSEATCWSAWAVTSGSPATGRAPGRSGHRAPGRHRRRPARRAAHARRRRPRDVVDDGATLDGRRSRATPPARPAHRPTGHAVLAHGHRDRPDLRGGQRRDHRGRGARRRRRALARRALGRCPPRRRDRDRTTRRAAGPTPRRTDDLVPAPEHLRRPDALVPQPRQWRRVAAPAHRHAVPGHPERP